VVTVAGVLDTCGAALLSAVLDQVRRSERAAAEADLSRVHYADSHGLAPLLDGQVTIRRTSPVVRRLLTALDIPSPRPAPSGPAPG
jgi:ABC-type transporter Mla MlaB component